ncbi:MAG: tetratricopeptide repeat protein [Clostridia bacterium]|nr:tetratricopeptide repeat protein [Clostridia bacterium]
MAATEKRTAVKETAAKEIKLPSLISKIKKGPTKTRFCFILGAGASRSSGIRMASELIEAWEKDLRESETEESLALWKKEKGIAEENYKEFYGDYYKRRFNDYRDGYDYLEKEMEGKLPGSGYILLAHVLCHTSHNIVITTNFDHLIEDAVNQWEHRFPPVIGHESLAHFIADDMDRPVIIKIHHDLLFGPKNRNDETNILDSRWQEHLPKIFSHYHPVFLGYAGNDLSLMNYLLENATKFKNGEWRSPYWTAYESTPLSGKPLEFIKAADGVYLRKCDFDSFMAALAQQVEYSIPPKEEFINDAKEKAEKDYDRLNSALNKNILENNKSDPKENEQIVNNAIMSITKDADSSDKDDASAIYRRAIRAFNNEKYDLAYRLFRKLIALVPDDALYHAGLGILLYVMKRYEKALPELQKAVELDPSIAGYHNSLGVTLRQLKRYEEALPELQKAIELDPNDSSYHADLGVVLYALNRYEEALKEYHKAIGLDPDISAYHFILSLLLHEIKNYEDSLQETQKAVDLEPDNADYHDHFADILYEMKRYEEALLEIQKAVDLEPNNANYHNKFGNLLYEMKHYEKAILEAQKAIDLEPDNALYHSNLGITLHTMKRYKEALQEKQKAVELEPDNEEYKKSLQRTKRAMK